MCCCFCSSVPCSMSVGPSIIKPRPPSLGAPASANSWLRMNWSIGFMPAPPYAEGQAGAIHPRSASATRHASQSGFSSSGRPIGNLPRISWGQ